MKAPFTKEIRTIAAISFIIGIAILLQGFVHANFKSATWKHAEATIVRYEPRQEYFFWNVPGVRVRFRTEAGVFVEANSSVADAQLTDKLSAKSYWDMQNGSHMSICYDPSDPNNVSAYERTADGDMTFVGSDKSRISSAIAFLFFGLLLAWYPWKFADTGHKS